MNHLCDIFALGLFLCSLLLPRTAIGDQPVSLYVSADGTDSNNNCQQENQPCQTIAHALAGVTLGAPFIIKTAKGTYEIQGTLYIPKESNVTIEGGWNRSFTARSSSPAETHLITGQGGAGLPALRIYSWDVVEKTSLTLRCMTIRPSTHYAFDQAVIVIADHAKAQLVMEHVRMTGVFAPGPVLTLSAQDEGTIVATVSKTLFDHNHLSENIIDIQSTGSMNCSLDRVRIVNNNLDAYKYGLKASSGLTETTGATIRTTIRNSIIAATGLGISIDSRMDSQNSLHLVNSTITGNPQGELRIHAINTSSASASLTNCIIKDDYAPWKDIQAKREGSATASITANHCILGDHEEISGATFSSSNGVNGDPLLTNTYHLRATSPAIDAGICGYWMTDLQGHRWYWRIAPEDDIDGDRRPGTGVVMGCDIGADEYWKFPWPMFLPAITGTH